MTDTGDRHCERRRKMDCSIVYNTESYMIETEYEEDGSAINKTLAAKKVKAWKC